MGQFPSLFASHLVVVSHFHLACDDGNAVNTDACLDTCVSATCGDGVTQADVEQCDDGNAIDTDYEACQTELTLVGTGSGTLAVAVDCGADGVGTYQ